MAYLNGRDYVLAEDIKDVALDVLNHRILLFYEVEAGSIKTKDLEESCEKCRFRSDNASIIV